MAVGSGLGGFAGVAPEASYGSLVAPTRFWEVESAAIKKEKHVTQGTGLGAGILVDRGARRVIPTQAVKGDIKADVLANGFGLMFAHALGSTATPVQQGTTTAYLQTHTLGDNRGLSLSAQIGIPDLGGVLHPYNFSGLKITDLELACAVDQLLTVTATIDGRATDETEALATPAFALGDPYHFGQMGVSVGATTSALVAVDGVHGFNVKLARPQNVARFYANGGGLKEEPITDGKIAITGILDADFVNKADFADRFSADTPFALQVSFTGAAIGTSGSNEYLHITLPECYLDTDTPTLPGPAVVTTGYNFTALYDGTNNPFTLALMSSDTAV